MPRSPLLLLPTLLAACVIENQTQGTAVGNPTELSANTASSKDLTWTSASAPLEALVLSPCDGGELAYSTESVVIDLLGQSRLAFPEGVWCRVTASFEGALHFTGVLEDGDAVELDLDVPSVDVFAPAGLDSALGPFVLELGSPDWVRSSDFKDQGQGRDEARTAELEAEIAGGSAVFRDFNADGSVDHNERDYGEAAEGEDRPDDDDGDDDDGD